MISGATGLPKSSIVTCITDVASLPSGVVQRTNMFTDASNHVDEKPANRTMPEESLIDKFDSQLT
jgi:hypothetical protein